MTTDTKAIAKSPVGHAWPFGSGVLQRHRLAWALWTLCVLFTLLNVVLLHLNWRTESPVGATSGVTEVASGVAYFILSTIGFAVVVRASRHGIGWVFLAASVALALGALASEYATYSLLTDPGSLPAPRPVAWLGAWAWWAGAGFGLTFGLLLFPNNALPSPRWRPVAWAASINVVLLALLHALTPGPLDGEFAMVVNPVGVDPASRLFRPMREIGWLLLAANGVVGMASLMVRLRLARRRERGQLWWMLVSGGTAVVAATLWGLTGAGDDGPTPVAAGLVIVALIGVPATLASAFARAAALRRSVERLVVAREEERRRIRRDLHDGLGPTLAGVALQLDAVREYVHRDPEAADRMLDRVVGQVKAGIADIRRLVDGLRPPILDQLGLAPAIRETASSFASPGSEFTVTVEANGDSTALPAALQVAAFRIAMEAINNARRHGRANACRVILSVNGELEIVVEDDGVGVPAEFTPGVGLSSMRERATELGGTCEVHRGRGGGTVVRAVLPLYRM